MAQESTQPLRVLLVEDDPVARRILSAGIRTAGYALNEAGTLLQAMREAAGHPPDIAIVDMRLPDGTGLELAQALRRLDGLSQLPMIAITGVETTLLGLEQYADLFVARLLKPVIPGKLNELIEKYASPPMAPDEGSVHLVVVDDEPLMRRLLEAYLTRAGYVVRVAADGLQALALIEKRTPDLVVADLDMPIMDGPALAAALRGQPTTASIPVVLVTAGLQSDAPPRMAEAAGVHAVIPKTNDLSRLQPAIEAALAAPRAPIDPAPSGMARDIVQLAAQARRVNELQASLDMKEAELNALAGIADAIRRARSESDVLRGTIERICDLSFVSFAAAWRPDGKTGLRLAGTASVPKAQLPLFESFPQDHALVRATARIGDLVALPSVLAPAGHGEAVLRSLGVSSALLIPLSHSGKPLGLLLLGSLTDSLRRDAWALGQTVQAQLEQALSLLGTVGTFEATANAFKSIADSLSEAVFTVGPGGRIVYANLVAEMLLAMKRSPTGELLGRWLTRSDGSAPGEGRWMGRLATVAGRERVVEVQSSQLAPGSPLGMLAYTVRDVTAQQDHERWLERLANEDALTGLPNRRAFDQRIAQFDQHENRRQRDAALGVIYFDLDGFKGLNDVYGHDAGDILLRAIADATRERLRDEEFMARLGGDEFGILLIDTNREEIAAVAEIMRELVATVAAEHPGHVTTSVGAALRERGQSATLVIEAADAAMYAAKRAGGNRVRLAERVS